MRTAPYQAAQLRVVIASERRHAPGAINTIPAKRSVVMEMRTHHGYLEEMRQVVLDDVVNELSHISDMLDHSRPSVTTLRLACVVLIAPVGTSHVSGMACPTTRHHPTQQMSGGADDSKRRTTPAPLLKG